MTLNKFLSCPRFFLLPSVRTGEFLRSTEPSSNRVIAGEKSSVLFESFHGHQLSSLPPAKFFKTNDVISIFVHVLSLECCGILEVLTQLTVDCSI